MKECICGTKFGKPTIIGPPEDIEMAIFHYLVNKKIMCFNCLSKTVKGLLDIMEEWE